MTERHGNVTRSVLVWRHVKCRLTETRDYRSAGWTKIDIEVVAPKGAPLPIGLHGRAEHQLEAAALAAAGGIATFVTAWLDREADTRRYAKDELRWRQGSLF